MPIRVLAIACLPLAAAADPPFMNHPGPDVPAAPVQPCLVDAMSCLHLAPLPFRPCLAAPGRCGDHFSLIPIGNSPRFMPAQWSAGRAEHPQIR